MHWAEKIAEKIIAKNPNKEEYVCAAGISPSGSIHIGNFRDVATSYFVVRALRKMGKKAKLLFSWDELDRLRKVPANVAAVDGAFEKHIGKSYVDIPNPFPAQSDAKTYADYFEREFMGSIREFQIDMDFRYQAEMYRKGRYADKVIFCLGKRKEIFDILDKYRTQDATEEEREAYYPVSIYCPACKKDSTKITRLGENADEADYTCACGYKGHIDFKSEFNCKLAWKLDWPMRWQYEGVDFEPGGRDHASVGGSYDVGKEISRKIFGYEPPIFQGYEFIGIRGMTSKMSGSTGLNLTPGTLLKIYQPEVLLWLYARNEPEKSFDFCFDDGILRHYFEFDKMHTECKEGTASELTADTMYYTTVAGRDVTPVPMSLLAQLGSVVNFNADMLEVVFEKIGTPYRYADFKDRLTRAKYWLEVCSPENVNTLRATRDFGFFESLSDLEKEEIAALHAYLSGGAYDLDALQSELYAIPRGVRGLEREAKELKQIQGKFFQNVYQLLIGKTKGPRLYLFLYAIERESYVKLLDFSYPQTAEEIAYDAAQKAEAEAVPVQEERDRTPDPVAPVKPEIDLAGFQTVDLRVCKILKCNDIRKSHNCYKLTLFDGMDERVIVSSLKGEYQPEELIGKKIIVIANLAPARITGVTSKGMLLAATNNACGCKVIFVDDSVPEGTALA